MGSLGGTRLEEFEPGGDGLKESHGADRCPSLSTQSALFDGSAVFQPAESSSRSSATEAGRSMTSPAAMREMTCGSSTCMGILFHLLQTSEAEQQLFDPHAFEGHDGLHVAAPRVGA